MMSIIYRYMTFYYQIYPEETNLSVLSEWIMYYKVYVPTRYD